MSKDDRIEVFGGLEGSDLVQKTFLFNGLNFDETAMLAGAFQRESFDKGDIIIEEDSIGMALFIVTSGQVEVSKGHGDEIQVLATLGVGELFGEMSLIEDALTSASITALEKTEVLKLEKEDLDSMMASEHEFALKVYKAFCQALSERLRKTSNELYQQHKQDRPKQ
jgi:CRP-like cAMP-binding protein